VKRSPNMMANLLAVCFHVRSCIANLSRYCAGPGIGVRSRLRRWEVAAILDDLSQTAGQINLYKSTMFLDKTKNGDARQVPLSSIAKAALRQYMKDNAEVIRDRQLRFFRWWEGDFSKAVLDRVTTYVSKTFADAFAEAKLDDFGFHDLRYDATFRLFLHATFSDTEIACIAGHKDIRMLKRYASLRGRARRAHVVADEPSSRFGLRRYVLQHVLKLPMSAARRFSGKKAGHFWPAFSFLAISCRVGSD